MRPRIALLSVYFSLFDAQMPPSFRAGRAAAAERFAATLAEQADVVWSGFVTTDEEGIAASPQLRDAAPDAIVFAPSMAAPPSYALHALAEVAGLPLVIWNAPGVGRLAEDLTQAGATEETTQVGSVMLANALVREGRRFAVVTARPDDPVATERLHRTVRAAAAAGALRGTSAMRVGDAMPGYVDVEATGEQLAALGVAESAVSVAELDAAVAAVAEPSARELLERLQAREGWSASGRAADPGDDAALMSARLALALRALAGERGAACGTVNCHGCHLRQNPAVGMTACLGASLLTEEGVPISCTGDQPTALTMFLARRLSGRALYCELYAPEVETGLMLVAAGGEGDTAWAQDGAVELVPNGHYPGLRGEGTALSFLLAQGPATLLSLSPDADGWRLAWATGEVIESRYPRMRGPNAMFRFDAGGSAEAGERWIASGATHHAALAAGRLDVELPALCEALGVRSVRV
jgi:L-arabinose isomerase